MTAPILIRKRIRLKVEADKWTNALDVMASATPRLYRGNDCQFEIGIFWNTELIDASNIASLTLSIWTADRKTRKASKTLTSADIVIAPVSAGWLAGTAQHATIPFTGEEMNWALTGALLEESYFLVLSGITTDSPGHEITYGVSILTLIEDADGAPVTSLPNNPNHYTQAEADARFVPLNGDQYSFRTRNGFLQFYTQEDAHWHSAIPKLLDGALTFTPGPPID